MPFANQTAKKWTIKLIRILSLKMFSCDTVCIVFVSFILGWKFMFRGVKMKTGKHNIVCLSTPPFLHWLKETSLLKESELFISYNPSRMRNCSRVLIKITWRRDIVWRLYDLTFKYKEYIAISLSLWVVVLWGGGEISGISWGFWITFLVDLVNKKIHIWTVFFITSDFLWYLNVGLFVKYLLYVYWLADSFFEC